MGLEIKVIEGRKGSNPGGLVSLGANGNSFCAYLKYCPGSKIPREYGFNAQNQPVYEAVTFEMARRLGLLTPEFYVLLNSNSGVTFSNTPGIRDKLDPSRKSYFVSRYVKPTQMEGENQLAIQMEKDAIYRNVLRIADIVGKRQNFLFLASGRIKYIDLGCSFVHAVDGFLQLKHNETRALSCHRKELKTALNQLSRYRLILRDDSNTLLLSEIARMPETITIPIFGLARQIRLIDMVNIQEVNNIVQILAMGMIHHLKDLKESDKIIKS